MSFAQKVGKEIKKMRESLGQTQVQLDKRCRLAPGSIQQYEFGRGASFETASKISNGLGCTLDKLAGR